MSKSRRASRTRGPRSDPAPPKAGPELASLDLLRVAADLVTALADAVVVTSRDRCVLTANRAAAELFGQLQWTAYEALGDWALEHPELEQADLLRIFMDFMWIGLERHSRGRHWTAGGSSRGRIS